MATRFQYLRLIEIDKEIRNSRFPNKRLLAEKFEVDPRTISRDLDFLKDSMGAPLRYDSRKRGYYYTDPSYFLPAQMLTEGELLSFFIAERALYGSAGAAFEPHLRTAVEKLCRWLPDTITVNLQELSNRCSFDFGKGRAFSESMFMGVSDAVSRRRRLLINYYTASRDASSERRVDPYHLLNNKGDWYLIAYCHSRKEIRVFALHRIREFAVLEETYALPADFNVASFLKDSFEIELSGGRHAVSIYFDPYQSRWARERVWHSSERRETMADGSLVLHFEVSGIDELKRWVLSFGRHAKILAPEWLKKEMEEETRSMLKVYENSPNP